MKKNVKTSIYIVNYIQLVLKNKGNIINKVLSRKK